MRGLILVAVFLLAGFSEQRDEGGAAEKWEALRGPISKGGFADTKEALRLGEVDNGWAGAEETLQPAQRSYGVAEAPQLLAKPPPGTPFEAQPDNSLKEPSHQSFTAHHGLTLSGPPQCLIEFKRCLDLKLKGELPEAELDVSGGKAKGGFHMPSFHMPHFKMPKWHLFGGKKVEFTPEGLAEYEKNLDLTLKGELPEGEFTVEGLEEYKRCLDLKLKGELPEAELDVSGGKAKGGFHMPSFHMPHFKMPKWHLFGGKKVEFTPEGLAEYEKNLDLTLKGELPEGEFTVEGLEEYKSCLDLKLKGELPEAELDVSGGKAKGGFHMPSFHMPHFKMPKWHLFGGKKVEFTPEGLAEYEKNLDLTLKGELPEGEFTVEGLEEYKSCLDLKLKGELPEAELDVSGGLKLPPFKMSSFSLSGGKLPKSHLEYKPEGLKDYKRKLKLTQKGKYKFAEGDWPEYTVEGLAEYKRRLDIILKGGELPEGEISVQALGCSEIMRWDYIGCGTLVGFALGAALAIGFVFLFPALANWQLN